MGGGNGHAVETATTLSAKGGTGRMDFESETFVVDQIAHSLKGEGHDAREDGTGRGVPYLTGTVGTSLDRGATLQDAACGMLIAGTLSASTGGVSGKDAPQVVAYRTTGNDGCYDTGDAVGALTSSTDQNAQIVAVSLRGRDGGTSAEFTYGAAPALKASQGGGDKAHVMDAAAVRRLTPTECERLMGVPDGYTRIPERVFKSRPNTRHFRKYRRNYERNADGSWTRFAADGPRYKALGNSIARPCLAHIGANLARALGLEITKRDIKRATSTPRKATT